MIQNILAQLIVISAFVYTVFSVIRNIRAKNNSKCGGCGSCAFKHSIIKTQKQNSKLENIKYDPTRKFDKEVLKKINLSN